MYNFDCNRLLINRIWVCYPPPPIIHPNSLFYSNIKMLVKFIYFQDIDAQLEHQLKLKGTGDQGYRPCIAFIACNTSLE